MQAIVLCRLTRDTLENRIAAPRVQQNPGETASSKPNERDV